jgi:hypothetical protein
MALFTLRLGIAVSPKVLQADCTQASTFSTAQRSCVIAIPADTYPRVASASLACALSSANAVNKVVSSAIVRSTDGGTTWASAGQINYGVLAAGKYAGLSNVATVEIEAGSLTHVAHETAHVDGDAAASILAQCKLVVTVGNRLGTMPPF